VGKRRLETALEAADAPAQVTFAWRPFELNPDMPADGIERKVYRARKFGEARSVELDRNMTEIGREIGIGFAFDRQQRTPNTRLAHRLVWEAGRQGHQDAIVTRLFQAYFEEGLDIGAPEVLSALAGEPSPDAAGVGRALSDGDSLEAVMELEQQGRRLGIEGVPFFVLLGKYGVSGAQPPEYWREALPKIAAEAAASSAPAA
jgi:predicted DsbA family dithiol-disulfide isomerase